ncbi:MAG: hypothetical protein D6746_04615 [Bacteroidetes bacterium]|nr:MAG: hypothetical protein D6746_04615 [Bacteroidota bacterium]
MRNLVTFLSLLVALCVLFNVPTARAQDHDDGHAHSHHHALLHFSHPLVSESPSPDTKVRFDIHVTNEPEGVDRTTLRVEAEYAFASWISLEIDAPYTFLSLPKTPSRDHLDNVGIGLKYANFALAEHGLLLGGGVEIGLPTGSEEASIGSDTGLEIEPFLDFGFQRGRWEVVSFLEAGFSTVEEEEADAEAGWRLSVRYALSPFMALFFEFDETHLFGGEEVGEDRITVAPGLKVSPLRGDRLRLGASLRLPVTSAQEFDAQVLFSLFYHI